MRFLASDFLATINPPIGDPGLPDSIVPVLNQSIIFFFSDYQNIAEHVFFKLYTGSYIKEHFQFSCFFQHKPYKQWLLLCF